MAEILATIASSEADYTSLSACEAGEQQDYTDGGGDNGVWRYIEAMDDTTAVIIDGSATGPGNGIKIEVGSGYGHEGVWNTGKQRLRDNANKAIIVSDGYVTIEGLQVEQYGTGVSDEGIRVAAGGDNCTIRNCLIRATTTTDGQDGIYAGDLDLSNVVVENCVIYGFGRTGINAQCYVYTPRTQNWHVRNCTIYGCGGTPGSENGAISANVDHRDTVVTFDCDNVIGMGTSGGNDFNTYNVYGTVNYTGDKNISSDSSANQFSTYLTGRTATANPSPGTGDWVIFTNITSGSEDFHLQSSAENDAEGYGNDLSAYFSDDFEGDTRSDWDAGADEIVAGGTDNLTADSIATGAPTVGQPTLGQTHALTASGISAGAPTVGQPDIGQTHQLTAQSIATGAPTVGSPTLSQVDVLEAESIATGSPTVGNPDIGQVHALTASGIAAGAPTVGQPAIGQEHALTAQGIATGAPTVGNPTLTSGHDELSAESIATGAPTVGTPEIGQIHALVAQGVAAGAPTVGNPQLNRSAMKIIDTRLRRFIILFPRGG